MRNFIAANWKMNKTIRETREFLEGFIPMVKGVGDVDIIIAPPFTSLSASREGIKGSNLQLSAQDVFWEEMGAYTDKCPSVVGKAARWVAELILDEREGR